MILAGDIGGTNTRIGLFEGSASQPVARAIEIFSSHKHKGLEEILEAFASKHQNRPDAACFGVAGPVRHGRVKTSNLPWEISAKQVARKLGLDSVRLANDLEVNAYGIAVLGAAEMELIHPGYPEATGNCALISPGTGLGEAGLLAEGNGDYRPYATEGGHADFAPSSEVEIELLRALRKRFDHVSFERVLSGPGLANIYQFFREADPSKEPSWLADELQAGDPAAVIAEHGLKGDSDQCEKALELFVSAYGAEAGNLALKTMATGGVYLGGGIAPRILPKLKEPTFIKSFLKKGRVAKLLDDIPVNVILNDKTALLGAARLAMLSQP